MLVADFTFVRFEVLVDAHDPGVVESIRREAPAAQTG